MFLDPSFELTSFANIANTNAVNIYNDLAHKHWNVTVKDFLYEKLEYKTNNL